jgi:hypothetical protein
MTPHQCFHNVEFICSKLYVTPTWKDALLLNQVSFSLPVPITEFAVENVAVNQLMTSEQDGSNIWSRANIGNDRMLLSAR